MAVEEVADTGTVLMQEIEAVGPPMGLVIILVSIYLMFFGYAKLKVVAAGCGAGIGYLLTPLIYSLSGDSLSGVPQLYFMIGVILLFAAAMALTIQTSIRIMASLLVYLCFSNLFLILTARGFDFVNSELVTGLMVVVAFFSVRLIRKYLSLMVSALLGSLGCMGGMLILTGESLTLMSPESASTLLMVAVMVTLSSVWQYKQMAHLAKKENEMPKLPDVQHPKGTPHPNPGMIDKGPKRRRLGDLPDLRDFS
jgi:hypothetical protein